MLYAVIFCIIMGCYFSTRNTPAAHNSTTLAWIMFALAMVVGMGDMLGGYDRYSYCQLFDWTADDVLAGKNPMSSDSGIMEYSHEMAYVLLNVIIAHVTANRYIFILLLTLFVYFMLYLSLKDYLDNYPLGLLMFTALYFFFTFTYLRQVCATCFAWYAYRYVIRRKLLPFLVCCFVAYKFHNSAIIFLPMYFIPIKKYPKSLVIKVMLALLIIGSTGLSASLYSIYGDASGADERAAQYEQTGHNFRLDYVIEVFVFLYIILKNYDRIPNDVKHIVFLNASLMFCAILLFFVTNSSAGRQSWYYMIGIIYTLSYLVTTSNETSKLPLCIYILMTVLFLRIDILWGNLINPYKTFLTNGHRQNDHIYQLYEYDDNYDKNKLYRPLFYLK